MSKRKLENEDSIDETSDINGIKINFKKEIKKNNTIHIIAEDYLWTDLLNKIKVTENNILKNGIIFKTDSLNVDQDITIENVGKIIIDNLKADIDYFRNNFNIEPKKKYNTETKKLFFLNLNSNINKNLSNIIEIQINNNESEIPLDLGLGFSINDNFCDTNYTLFDKSKINNQLNMVYRKFNENDYRLYNSDIYNLYKLPFERKKVYDLLMNGVITLNEEQKEELDLNNKNEEYVIFSDKHIMFYHIFNELKENFHFKFYKQHLTDQSQNYIILKRNIVQHILKFIVNKVKQIEIPIPINIEKLTLYFTEKIYIYDQSLESIESLSENFKLKFELKFLIESFQFDEANICATDKKFYTTQDFEFSKLNKNISKLNI